MSAFHRLATLLCWHRWSAWAENRAVRHPILFLAGDWFEIHVRRCGRCGKEESRMVERV